MPPLSAFSDTATTSREDEARWATLFALMTPGEAALMHRYGTSLVTARLDAIEASRPELKLIKGKQ